MIETAIKKVANNENLTFNEAENVMDEIMNGKTNDIQISSYLTALSMKKETVAEIAGSAKAMRDHALPFNAGEEVLEIVGTGGDHANTFNISSTSAIVVAQPVFRLPSMVTELRHRRAARPMSWNR